MSNDLKRMAEALSKLEGSNSEYDGSIPNAARTFIRREITLHYASALANGADAVAANASAFIADLPANGRVVMAKVRPSADATANASNNASINVIEVHANGVIGTTIATANTAPTANGGLGSLSKGARYGLTVTDKANARYAQGAGLVATVSQNSSGVAMGAGTVTVTVELEGSIDEAN